MPTSSELRKKAWESLKGTYWIAFFVSIVCYILYSLQGGVSGFMGSISETLMLSEDYSLMSLGFLIYLIYLMVIGIFWLLSIFVGYPLIVGTKKFYIENVTGAPKFSVIKAGFTENYKGNVFVMFLMNFKIFLWSLLFIIPGIIKAYEYSMIPYILAEKPGISYADAFTLSKKYMTGNKMKLFVLELSFIPWWLLVALTCGCGLYFFYPYYEATYAEFYVAVKNLNAEEPAPITEN